MPKAGGPGTDRAKSGSDELGAGGEDGGATVHEGVCCGPDVGPERESHFKCFWEDSATGDGTECACRKNIHCCYHFKWSQLFSD